MKLYPNISLIFCIWTAAVLLLFYLSYSMLPHTDLFPHNFTQNLANWDGNHYVSIAQKGYMQKSQYVFFPLFPILINLGYKITGNYILAGLLISWVSLFLALNFLYKLVRLDFGKIFAQKSILFLLFFPLSFHFLVVYSESIFLFLSVLTFYLLRQKRFFLATIFAALSSATRLSGVSVVLGLIFYVYLTEGFNKKNWFVLLSPIGFVGYCIYLYLQTGDPFYFVSAESHYWGGGLVIPGSALIFSIKQLLMPGFLLNNFRVLLDTLFTVFGILMIYKMRRLLKVDLVIYSTFSLLLTLFSPTIVAIPRYLVVIFPIFIVLSFFKNQYILLAYQMISLLLLSVYAILFINGYWVS